jgi:hypothetical protein
MNRDGLPASLRAKADRDAQRYQELKKTGLFAPGPPAAAAPRSPQSSSSSSSSRPLASEEEEEDSSIAESQEIDLDPADLADSDDGALEDSEAAPSSSDDVPLDELEGSDLEEEGAGEDDDDDDDDDDDRDAAASAEADDSSGPEADEQEQPDAAAEAAAIRTRLLSPAHLPVVYSLLADPMAQDTIRTVAMRHGHPPEVINKISREVESDLLFALRTQTEHITGIMVSPPAVTEPGLAAALRTRAKNSRDLRHAMNYLDAYRKPTVDYFRAVAAYRGPARSVATPKALKRKLGE